MTVRPPELFTATTGTGPAGWAGLSTRREVSDTTWIRAAATPPKVMLRTDPRLDPSMVTQVPPAAGPRVGLTEVTTGASDAGSGTAGADAPLLDSYPPLLEAADPWRPWVDGIAGVEADRWSEWVTGVDAPGWAGLPEVVPATDRAEVPAAAPAETRSVEW